METLVQHKSYNDNRGLSAGLWATCPTEAFRRGDGGVLFFDDFLKFPVMASATAQDGYWTFQDTGCTVQPAADGTEGPGIVEIKVDATGDNEEAWLGTGTAAGFPLWQVRPTADLTARLWFEARVRFGQISVQNFFCGLTAPGDVDGDGIIADDDTLAADERLGWYVLAADPDAIMGVYGDTTQTDYAASESVIVADTWYKLGIGFNIHGDGKVYWYLNGVRLGAGIAGDATQMPNAQDLTLAIGGKSQGAVALEWHVDWVAIAMDTAGL
jgi:hypothetical protein